MGFQCPECLAEGRKGTRQAKTALGGEIRENSSLLTKSLIAINAVVWVAGLLIGRGTLSAEIFRASGGGIVWDEVTARFGLLMGLDDPLRDPFQIGVTDGEWYRLFTAAFVHEEFIHLGLNMFLLWILGSQLEPVLGRWRFAALYILSALGGSAVSLMSGNPYLISIGASGAVFGLFGAFIIVMRRLGRDITFAAVILGINVVFGFVRSGIDWRAHLGGLVIGAVVAFAFAHAPRQRRVAWSIAVCAVVLAAIVAVVVVLAT